MDDHTSTGNWPALTGISRLCKRKRKQTEKKNMKLRGSRCEKIKGKEWGGDDKNTMYAICMNFSKS